jgi:hypothetical protein
MGSSKMKICVKKDCEFKSIPQPIDNFYLDKGLKDGRANQCKNCAIKASSKRYETTVGRKKPIFGKPPEGTKFCTNKRCTLFGMPQQFDHFYKDISKGGLSSRCKNCVNNDQKLSYLKNPEKKKLSIKLWGKANPERVKTSKDKYALNHKEEKRTSNRLWAKANPEKVYLGSKRWHEANRKKSSENSLAYAKRNPFKISAINARKNAAKLKRTPSWTTPKMKAEIEFFYWLANKMTKTFGVRHEVDHYYPLQGKLISGLHVPSNLRVITKQANCSKGNKFTPETYNFTNGVAVKQEN